MAQLTAAQRAFAEKAYSAAYDAGLSGPQADLAVAQAVHETGWGAKPSGINNYHGIKGPGTKVATHEIVGGRRINVRDSFRNFKTMTDSFKAWGNLMDRRFGSVLSAPTVGEAVKGLRAGLPGGYATDPNYNSKVNSIANRVSRLDPMTALPSPDRIATPVENPRSMMAYAAPVAPVERAALAPVQQTAFNTGGILNPAKVSPVSTAQAAPAQAAPAGLARGLPNEFDMSRFGPAVAPNPSLNSLRALPSVPSLQSAPAPFSPTPASYQTPAFSMEKPQIDAFGQPPAPGLQPAQPSQFTPSMPTTIESPKVASVPAEIETPEEAPAPNPALNSFPAAPKKSSLLSNVLNPTTLASAAIGNMVAGPVGGLLGGLLGNSIKNSGGLGGLLGAYSGPTTNVGSGLGAINAVRSGGLAPGSTAFSRSMPGFSVTSLPGGGVQTTNQYGVTQITTPDGRLAAPSRSNGGGIRSESARNSMRGGGMVGLF